VDGFVQAALGLFADGLPSFIAKYQATPRSRRTTFFRPQLCAMSVALEDHGDTVPKRGRTTRSSPFGSALPGVP